MADLTDRTDRTAWVRDLEGAIMPVGTPNNCRIHDCDGSNGQR